MPYDIVIGRNKEDKEKFGNQGLIYLGRGYVKMGNYTSLSNKIWLDVARSHIILIAGKRGCLTGETNVFTDKGYKPIKEFNIKEDKILSFNKEKKEFEWETADLLKYNISKENLLEIELEDGRKLQLTKEHPLLFIIGDKLLSLMWLKANELKKGDYLLSVDNKLKDLEPIKIKSINYISNINEVYDLSVSKNHSFIANGIISHNSGKSYSIGVIAEELSDLPEEVKKNIAPLIFDTMGIFWTMKYKNEKDIELLEEWELKPRNLPANVWVPAGYFDEYEKRGIPVDKKFALAVSELNIEDWLSIFNLEMTEPISVLIQKVISELQSLPQFDIEDIIELINKTTEAEEQTKKSAKALFEAAESWRVFAKKNESATKITDLICAGKTSILDLSVYSSTSAFNVRALIIGLVSKKLFNQRILARKKEEIESIKHGIDSSYEEKKEMPIVWLFLDECLTGETEIITDKAHTPMQEIVKRFENGEKFKVLGFNKENNNYGYYDIINVYKKGKRKVMKLTTETGREIISTPEHRVLTSQGVFASAFSVPDIAFPLFQYYSTNPKLIEARILGHLFGDGWIYDKKKTLGFSGKGNKEDLKKIRTDLSKLGFKSTNIYERKTTSKINHKGKIIIVNGTSQSFQSTGAYKYFREKAGFSGVKTIIPINIPDYLFNASDLEKAEFLSALMGSDGQKISKAKNAGGDFNAIRFSFNKIENLEKEALNYANQIKRLFEDLGIKISSISKREGNLRKDGNKTIKIIITLKKNIENTIKFLEKIGYRYCSEKEIRGLRWCEYLKARLFLKREREKIYEKAIKLHEKGLGKTKISKLLNFPEAQIRDWIYNNTKPGLPKVFPDIEEWFNKREKNNILFEKVFKIEENGEEEVYDISIDKVHNFVSNGLITHNCHEFLPQNEKTPASNALIQLLREGRQPGISLVLATQQPGVIHRDVMTQSDIIISHRLTNKKDIEALNEIMQSYLLETINKSMRNLPDLRGSAILLDDNSERLYPVRIRPRFTWHGGEAPKAVSEKEKF
jgi:intein/homing endonuclease